MILILAADDDLEQAVRTAVGDAVPVQTAPLDRGLAAAGSAVEVVIIDGADDAERAFTEVAKRKTTGDNAWVGEWRLAEVAAFRHDPVAFERHIVTALERGFTFRNVMGLPNWRGFYADPALRDTLDKLLSVYADPDVKESLAPAPAP